MENRSAEGEDRTVKAPLTGKVVQINYREGDEVSKGNSVLVIESMKMEIPVEAPCGGTIAQICVSEGDAIEEGIVLVVIE